MNSGRRSDGNGEQRPKTVQGGRGLVGGHPRAGRSPLGVGRDGYSRKRVIDCILHGMFDGVSKGDRKLLWHHSTTPKKGGCGRTGGKEYTNRMERGANGPTKKVARGGELRTLCNACGLRWAKQARKVDDTSEGGGTNTSVLYPAVDERTNQIRLYRNFR